MRVFTRPIPLPVGLHHQEDELIVCPRVSQGPRPRREVRNDRDAAAPQMALPAWQVGHHPFYRLLHPARPPQVVGDFLNHLQLIPKPLCPSSAAFRGPRVESATAGHFPMAWRSALSSASSTAKSPANSKPNTPPK